ncbi:MAG: hypothetical protein ACRC35_12085 [Angustibacter sp.]
MQENRGAAQGNSTQGNSTREELGHERRTGQAELRRVRRVPRYRAFLGAGAGVGLLTAIVVGVTGPADPSVGRGSVIGYLALLFGLLGAVTGGAVAVVLERRHR